MSVFTTEQGAYSSSSVSFYNIEKEKKNIAAKQNISSMIYIYMFFIYIYMYVQKKESLDTV